MSQLQQFAAGNYSYGFIEGPKGYIVTETDFCHQVRTLNENIEMRIRMPWEAADDLLAFQCFTLDQLRELAQPIPCYRKWAHYWGIKARIAGNYQEFLASMREIGLATGDMPKWGEEPKDQTVVAEETK